MVKLKVNQQNPIEDGKKIPKKSQEQDSKRPIDGEKMTKHLHTP